VGISIAGQIDLGLRRSTIVGAGIVVTCVGLGAILSLSVFLTRMAAAIRWSRTGISIAALLNFLCLGIGSFLWGALSDQFGTRAVVLCGRVLLGVGQVTRYVEPSVEEPPGR